MSDEYTPDEAERMLKLLGLGVLNVIRSAQDLGHTRAAYTANTYIHLAYPPVTENMAAASVVVDLVRSAYTPDELVDRHPWLPLLDEHYPRNSIAERKAS